MDDSIPERRERRQQQWQPPSHHLIGKSQTLAGGGGAQDGSLGIGAVSRVLESLPPHPQRSRFPYPLPVCVQWTTDGENEATQKDSKSDPVRVKISGIRGGLNLKVDYPLANAQRELVTESLKNRPWNSNREGTRLQPARRTSHPAWVNTNRPPGESTAGTKMKQMATTVNTGLGMKNESPTRKETAEAASL